MCGNICRQPSYLCICVIIILHVIFFVSLGTTLYIRYGVYSTQEYTSMATDQRIVGREADSIMCSSHKIESYLIDNWNQSLRKASLESNNLPGFDVYRFTKDPEEEPLLNEKPIKLRGAGQMNTGMYHYNVFHLLKNSNISISVCTRYEEEYPSYFIRAETGLFVYFLKGSDMFKDFTDKWEKNRSKPPCTGKDCPPNKQVRPINDSQICTNATLTTFNATANETEDYYVLIVNPDETPLSQNYAIDYNLNRTMFNLTSAKKENEKLLTEYKYKADNDEYIVVHFNHTRNNPNFHLYNIRMEYNCDSAILMYLLFFFAIPFAIIIILAVVLACYQDSQPLRNRLLSDAEEEPDRGLLNNPRSYGSQDAVYS